MIEDYGSAAVAQKMKQRRDMINAHFSTLPPEVQKEVNRLLDPTNKTDGVTRYDHALDRVRLSGAEVSLFPLKQNNEPIKLTPGWGDGGRSMKANKGKLVNSSVTEDQGSVDAVASAITYRITRQHPELLRKYGLDKVEAAIESVAEFAGADGLEEIGGSDISSWTKQVMKDLEAGHFDHMESVNEALNVKQIKTDLDSGMSIDAVIGKHANKNTANTDEIRKIIKQHAWNNRMRERDKVKENRNFRAAHVAEDFGSSDGAVLVKSIDNAVAARGLSPEVIQDEAEHLAELYYDSMGYNSPEEAVDRIIDIWKLRSSAGRALVRMFAKPEPIKLRGFGPNREKGNMGSSVARSHLMKTPTEETEQLDEILPVLGAMAGRAAFAGAGAITRGVAGMAGRVVGSAAQSALDDNDEDPTDEASKGDAVDTVTMDVPLLLRMLEYAREDAQEDMDLHTVAEKMIELAKMGTLTMDQYDAIVMGDDQTQQVDESHAHAVDNAAHERVTYSKTKTVGDADVTVSANAGSLEELQYILKLAGLPDHLAVQPSAVEIVPQVHSEPMHSEPAEPCGCDATTSYEYDKDVKYSTDKQTLMNYLKDQLNKRID